MGKKSQWIPILSIATVIIVAVSFGAFKYHQDHSISSPSSGMGGYYGPSTPPQSPSPTKEEVSINSVTSPAYPGNDATLNATTSPNSDCVIEVDYKSGPSHAQGLYEHNADSGGAISWTWFVGTNTTPGTWPISVTCTNSSGSNTANTSFEVQ